jgi:Txe/YoeB family toxin of Txe-Axe toxin-antitoxin module
VDKEELVNYYEEMKELGNQISQTATSSREKEVIQQKVKSMVRKIDSIIEEAKRSEVYTG